MSAGTAMPTAVPWAMPTAIRPRIRPASPAGWLPRRVPVAVALLLTATVASGCTLGDDADPAGSAEGSAPPGVSGSAAPASGDGPSPEELSRALLDTRGTSGAIGSVTTPVDRLRGVDVVLDVLEVTRTGSGTRVTFRLSTSATGVSISALTFGGGRSTSQYFLHDVLLEDADVTAARYRPLRFEDYRQACVCPFLPLAVGAEPRTVTALFPQLPAEVQRVSLVLGDSALTVADLPVVDSP
ncbi:MAG: hypothetical protein ACFCVF_14480 [Kineosporiaceae bacterium]